MPASLIARAPLLLTLMLVAGSAPAGQDYGIGHVATPAEISGWDIDVAPNGAGLPSGAGSVGEGKAIFAEKCAACHGERGQGGPMDRLAGGAGTISTAKPVRTVGSYWPYATTLFDFIRRAMPFDAPQSLSPPEVYAVSAYVLFLNGLIPEDATLDANSLPQVVMPNRGAFVNAYEQGSKSPKN
jgi:S-disulfanyl-L-cysteine oxidoreductase SoxD